MKIALLASLLVLGTASFATGCDKKDAEPPAKTAEGDKAKAPDKAKAEAKAGESDKAKAAEGDKAKAAEGDKAKAGEGEKVVSEGDKKRKLARYMQDHYNDLSQARTALVHGKLDDFKKFMTTLSGRALPEGAPDSWKPFVPKMAAAAKAGTTVKDLAGASEALGTAAAA